MQVLRGLCGVHVLGLVCEWPAMGARSCEGLTQESLLMPSGPEEAP